jgi:hypothetical protein
MLGIRAFSTLILRRIEMREDEIKRVYGEAVFE